VLCILRDVPTMSEATIDVVLSDARRQLDRVAPQDLADEVANGSLLVDIRPAEDRHLDGELPGAVVIERIHLEWRLDPTSPDRIPEAGPDRRVIVVCNEGYASSLAAVTLRTLGVRRATDLEGGYRALRARAGRHRTSAVTMVDQ
jgi:rhodanese-related sulfurtransferase